jgi:hypothetical protein
MSGGSYGTYYMSERKICFVNFMLAIDPQGLGVLREETILDVGIQGRGFDGFGDHVDNVFNRVFDESFICGRRKEGNKFGLIIRRVHNHSSISFVDFEDNDVKVLNKATNRINFLFSEVGFRRFGTMKDSYTFLPIFFSFMIREMVGNGFNGENNILHMDALRG